MPTLLLLPYLFHFQIFITFRCPSLHGAAPPSPREPRAPSPGSRVPVTRGAFEGAWCCWCERSRPSVQERTRTAGFKYNSGHTSRQEVLARLFYMEPSFFFLRKYDWSNGITKVSSTFVSPLARKKKWNDVRGKPFLTRSACLNEIVSGALETLEGQFVAPLFLLSISQPMMHFNSQKNAEAKIIVFTFQLLPGSFRTVGGDLRK